MQNFWAFDHAPDKPQVREEIRFTVLPSDDKGRTIDFYLKLTNMSSEAVTFLGAKDKGYGGLCIRPDAGRLPFTFTTASGVCKDDALSFDTPWAECLKEKGLDPENQLCTDDFAGHLAHNANLSLKAINALGAYAMMCEMLGKPEAASYRDKAKKMAAEWVKMADDGDHYRLTFDKPGTWSLKYNLVWDRIFGLGLFPAEAAEKEVAHYLKVQNKYGVPLDMRKDYTKSDWLVWSAALSTSQSDFEKLIEPLHRFCQETPDRLPFTDWYDTKTAKCVGFRARPVIGGIFIKFLDDDATWKKWLLRKDER